ncbi:MAG: lamin tail domain-containing protein [Verrucomicrobia bacterium]|nr:lamin tail domain-containing protein [Verrucomicrobiota bacterium]
MIFHLGTAVCSAVAGELSASTSPGGSMQEPPGPASSRTALVLSEIHYHPADRPDGLDLEFVELFNSNPWPEDLGGFRLAGSVQFTFPAGFNLGGGAHVVIARSPDSIRRVHGITNVVGPFVGQLPNNSGTIQLENSSGAVLLDVGYSDNPPWPVAADGAGHSLVLRRPSFGNGSAQAWGASRNSGGSPGGPEILSPNPWDGLVIEEALANPAPAQAEFIEIGNRGHEPVDASGCWLSDSPDTSRFRIPDGTRLGPGERVVFSRLQLGFGLKASGDEVFLRTPDTARVIDAVRFGGSPSGFSWGLWTGDGGWRLLDLPTPGTPNRGLHRHDVVINEIHYDPVSRLDDDQFVELHNSGTRTLDLGGWRFSNGIRFTFPPGQTLAPGEFLVVARNSARMRERNPDLPQKTVVGEFAGRLDGGGELLRLVRPEPDPDQPGTFFEVTVDEVTYNTGGRWPTWANGGGSSLERIDPRADSCHPATWADSDETGKAPWTLVEHTGPLDHGLVNGISLTSANEIQRPDTLEILPADPGEWLVDDVWVGLEGSTNRVTNATFDNGLTGWTRQGSLERSSLSTNEAFTGSSSLRLRAESRGDPVVNRVFTTLRPALPTNGVATLRARVRWLRGSPHLVFRLHGNWLELAATVQVPAQCGTPGRPNSTFQPNLGPSIRQVAHFPVLPARNEAVRVTARISDPDAVGEVRLAYQPSGQTQPTTIPMTDDGLAEDDLPGDGVFTAVLPGQSSATTVAFWIETQDLSPSPATSRFPADATRSCLVRWGESPQPGPFGSYHLWTTPEVATRWANRPKLHNGLLDTTLVYGGFRAIYNAGVNFSGSPWAASLLPAMVDYSVVVPPDDPLLGREEFTLQSPGNVNIADPTALRESTAYWFAQRLGLPACHRRPVVLLVNGVRRNPNSILEETQQPGTEMVQQWFPKEAEGTLFKLAHALETTADGVTFRMRVASLENFVTAGGVKKTARYRWNWQKRGDGARQPHDFSDLFALVDAIEEGRQDGFARLRELIDVEQWMTTFALQRVIGNWDTWGFGIPGDARGHPGQNLYAYKPANGKWKLLVWDLDQSMEATGEGGSAIPPNTDIFFSNEARDSVCGLFFREPFFQKAYVRAFSNALAGPLRASEYESLLLARHQALTNAGFRVTSPAGIQSYLSRRRAQIEAQTADFQPVFRFYPPRETTEGVQLVLDGPDGVHSLESTDNLNSWQPWRDVDLTRRPAVILDPRQPSEARFYRAR